MLQGLQIRPLAKAFREPDAYRQRSGKAYALLPIRFLRLDEQRYLATNFAGEYIVLAAGSLRELVEHRLPQHTDIYNELKSRHFLMDGDSSAVLDLLACKYRTKQALL